ncbi:hypothetical protein BB561_002656 [Smittium simulii]|uniref:Uncharacterized protein n=1 Tax=Smittium simulii TaxID=133385 RepID=A0A2T9YPP5_9FUNG|nr:hypothetical protein BB561_006869 [Smittium simulii]PVU94302.1 hypothetical protein BB561_002656 [Smittium simulii]
MRPTFLSSALLCKLFLLISASAKTIQVDWTIDYVQANPDGLFDRRVIGVNNQFPLPRLEGNFGDTIIVNAKNNLDKMTSLHAHGLSFNNNAFSDGAVSVNHCGIPPGKNHTYKLELNEEGTYWFHSHTIADYADGLRTPLIVYPSKNVSEIQYDEDLVMSVSDWYHEEANKLASTVASKENPGGVEPPPNSGLINDIPNPKYKISPGKTYRLRIINFSTMGVFHVKLDRHDMKLVEIDGVTVQPMDVKSIELSPSQRASVIFTAKENTSKNFYILADADPAYYDFVPDYLKLNVTIPLIYDDNSEYEKPEDHLWDTPNDFDIVPLDKVEYKEPDQTFVFVSDIKQLDDEAQHGLINGITYRPPKVPILMSMMTTGDNATNPAVYGPRSNAYVTGFNQTIRIVIDNRHFDPHPFHIHGHKFQVISVSEEKYSEKSKFEPKENWNPARRDTLNVPGYGHAILQFYSDNPGAWPIHCHNNWHMIFGMMGVIVEAPLEAQKMYKFDPESYKEMCALNGFLTSGNGAGREGLDLTGAVDTPSGINYGIHAKGIIALVFCIFLAISGILSIVFYEKQLINKIEFEKASLLDHTSSDSN